MNHIYNIKNEFVSYFTQDATSTGHLCGRKVTIGVLVFLHMTVIPCLVAPYLLTAALTTTLAVIRFSVVILSTAYSLKNGVEFALILWSMRDRDRVVQWAEVPHEAQFWQPPIVLSPEATVEGVSFLQEKIFKYFNEENLDKFKEVDPGILYRISEMSIYLFVDDSERECEIPDFFKDKEQIQALRESVSQSSEKVRAELANWIEKSWIADDKELNQIQTRMSEKAQEHLKALRGLGSTQCNFAFMKDCGRLVRDQLIEAEKLTTVPFDDF